MDSQQAKEILASYRPNTGDAQEAIYAEALAQARRDPELARWLIQQQAIDAALRRKFSEIPAPAAVKERILADQRIVRPQVWPVRPAFIGLAAAAAIILWAVHLWLQPPPPPPAGSFAAYRDIMAEYIAGEYQMKFRSKDLSEIRQFLASHQGQADYILSPTQEKLSGDGCALVDWQGKKATLVCFDLGQHNDLYLFVCDRSTMTAAPPPDSPQFTEVGPLATAGWIHGDKTYLLALKGDIPALRKYL